MRRAIGVMPSLVPPVRGSRRLRAEGGQAAVLLVATAFVLLLGVGVLGALAKGLLGKGRLQRAGDLAAVSAARSMRDDYARLFERPRDAQGRPNPRHIEKAEYLARAREAAVAVGRRNGLRLRPAGVSFPDGASLAPVRVRVEARDALDARAPGGRREEEVSSVPVEVKAEAELVPSAGGAAIPVPGAPATAMGGGYAGPLAYRQGKPMRPDVARAFDRMDTAAQDAGIALVIAFAYRSDAEQARLFARRPDPRWVAPPGRSLHRYGTELDVGPPAAYGWLSANARRFGFIRRYSWEPWHFGYVGGSSGALAPRGASAADSSTAASTSAPSRNAVVGADPSGPSLPAFVPARFAAAIARAASRWNVPADLLAAQLYAESGFNPFARSPVGALGIAQFMPGTARAYGLRDPFDPEAAIDAQARLMRDLLARFRGSVALALAAYNAGPGAVERYGGIPPYPETRAYVARILGLMGGAGALPAGLPGLEVRLVDESRDG